LVADHDVGVVIDLAQALALEIRGDRCLDALIGDRVGRLSGTVGFAWGPGIVRSSNYLL